MPHFNMPRSGTVGLVAATTLILAWAPVAGGAEKQSSAPASTSAGVLVDPPEVTVYTLLLLRDAAVRDELKLLPKQVAAIDALLAEVEYPLFLLRDAAVKERDAGLAPLQQTIQLKLDAALNAAQHRRFEQLLFQARGAEALTAPDAVTRLGLSTQQVDAIAKIRSDTKAAIEQLDKDNADKPAAEQAAARRKRQQQESDAIVAQLDDSQRAKLAGLVGKSFDLSRMKWVATAAPELRKVAAWINTEPVELKQYRGKVVVVHFWAFGCINCIRNLPCYQRWYEKFPSAQVAILGIHTPETAREKELDNLRQKVIEYKIEYPVAFDAGAENWQAWGNRMWPSVYLVDKQGRVRSWWYGELNWQGTPGEEIVRQRIEALVDEP